MLHEKRHSCVASPERTERGRSEFSPIYRDYKTPLPPDGLISNGTVTHFTILDRCSPPHLLVLVSPPMQCSILMPLSLLENSSGSFVLRRYDARWSLTPLRMEVFRASQQLDAQVFSLSSLPDSRTEVYNQWQLCKLSRRLLRDYTDSAQLDEYVSGVYKKHTGPRLCSTTSPTTTPLPTPCPQYCITHAWSYGSPWRPRRRGE